MSDLLDTVRPHYASVTGVLHWIPVRRRVDFKMATLVYPSLSGMAPAFLAADCQMVSDKGRCQLRSATSRTCVNCEANLQQLWRQVFCSCRSDAVNSLPADLRQADISFQRFKRLLKTFLFGC